MGKSIRIARIGGIDVSVDSSWIFLAILITYTAYVRVQFEYDNVAGGTAFAIAVLSTVVFLLSVLAHELAHAGMARALGIPVSGITLWLFGGATGANMDDRGPKEEFLVTIVGPLTSIALGAVLIVVSSLGNPSAEALPGAIRYLGGINILLGLFNLIPGLPLDGGRVLRSIVWKVSGNLERATQVAAIAGIVVASALIAVGLVLTAGRDPGYGLWLAVIGWILLQGAQGFRRNQRLKRALSGGRAFQAMRPPPPAVPAEISLSDALDRYLRGHEGEAFPVVDDGRAIGLLTFSSASRVGRDDPLRPVRDAMVPLTEVVTVDEEEPLDQVADRLGRTGAAVVLRDGALVGAITADDVYRWLRAHA